MITDRYQQITTLSERYQLDKLCQLLEDARIPVMVEHADTPPHQGHLFYISVPSRCFQQAAYFVDSIPCIDSRVSAAL